MIDYELTKDENALKLKAAEFSGRDLAQKAKLLDEVDRSEIPAMMKENLKKLAEAGLLAPGVSDGGVNLIENFIAGEEIAKACPSTWLSARASGFLCAGAISLFGTAEQKKKYLPELTRGAKIGCLAYSEPNAGSDLSSIATVAVPLNGHWVVGGLKDIVVNAPIADIFLVLSWTDRNAGPAAGMSLFILHKGTHGLSAGKPLDMMGMRGSPVSSVNLENCEAGEVLGNVPGKGFAQVARLLEMGRVGAAALCVGIGTACMEKATAQAKSHKAFGKPIGVYQEVGFKLADMFAFNDLGRMLSLRAAWAFNKNEPEAEIFAACAKVFAGESVTKISNWATQVFSGHGYIKGTDIERLYRDARFCEFCEGTSEVLRIAIAKNELDKFKGA
jgi:alkylation response protein AidB-like acyl-CoA dehydrogenase